MRHTLAAIVAVAVLTGSALLAQAPRSVEVELKAAQHKEEVEGDLKGRSILSRKIGEGTDRAIAGQALIRLAEAYQKLGDLQARGVYRRPFFVTSVTSVKS